MREGVGDREKGRHRSSESFGGSKGLRTPGPSLLGPEVGTALPRATARLLAELQPRLECRVPAAHTSWPGTWALAHQQTCRVGWSAVGRGTPCAASHSWGPGKVSAAAKAQRNQSPWDPPGVPSAQHTSQEQAQPHSVLPLGDRARGAQAPSQPRLIHRMQPLRSQHSPAKPCIVGLAPARGSSPCVLSGPQTFCHSPQL